MTSNRILQTKLQLGQENMTNMSLQKKRLSTWNEREAFLAIFHNLSVDTPLLNTNKCSQPFYWESALPWKLIHDDEVLASIFSIIISLIRSVYVLHIVYEFIFWLERWKLNIEMKLQFQTNQETSQIWWQTSPRPKWPFIDCC